jgi:hypothetical protein
VLWWAWLIMSLAFTRHKKVIPVVTRMEALRVEVSMVDNVVGSNSTRRTSEGKWEVDDGTWLTVTQHKKVFIVIVVNTLEVLSIISGYLIKGVGRDPKDDVDLRGQLAKGTQYQGEYLINGVDREPMDELIS